MGFWISNRLHHGIIIPMVDDDSNLVLWSGYPDEEPILRGTISTAAPTNTTTTTTTCSSTTPTATNTIGPVLVRCTIGTNDEISSESRNTHGPTVQFTTSPKTGRPPMVLADQFTIVRQRDVIPRGGNGVRQSFGGTAETIAAQGRFVLFDSDRRVGYEQFVWTRQAHPDGGFTRECPASEIHSGSGVGFTETVGRHVSF